MCVTTRMRFTRLSVLSIESGWDSKSNAGKLENPKNGTQATNHLGFVLMGIRDLFRQLMGHSWRPGEEYHSL